MQVRFHSTMLRAATPPLLNLMNGITSKLNLPDEKHSATHTVEKAYSLQSWFARTAAGSSAQRSGIPQTVTAEPFGSATINSKAVNVV